MTTAYSRIFFGAVLIFVFLTEAPAQEIRKMVLCKNGKAVRTIRVEKDHRDNEGWVTLYNKGGSDEVVGEGLNPKSCEDVLERVQKAIEPAGWRCRGVSPVSPVE